MCFVLEGRQVRCGVPDIEYNHISTKQLVCKTCESHLKKSQTPPQTVWHKVAIVPVSPYLKFLNRLEGLLISRRILFKKVTIILKRQFSKLRGTICNIPTEADDTINIVPQETHSNGQNPVAHLRWSFLRKQLTA